MKSTQICLSCSTRIYSLLQVSFFLLSWDVKITQQMRNALQQGGSFDKKEKSGYAD